MEIGEIIGEEMCYLTSPQSSPNRRGSSLSEICLGNTPSPWGEGWDEVKNGKICI